MASVSQPANHGGSSFQQVVAGFCPSQGCRLPRFFPPNGWSGFSPGMRTCSGSAKSIRRQSWCGRFSGKSCGTARRPRVRRP